MVKFLSLNSARDFSLVTLAASLLQVFSFEAIAKSAAVPLARA